MLGGFTEELVLDRYAAIDAGLEPVEVESVFMPELVAAVSASQFVAPTQTDSADTAFDTITHIEPAQNRATIEIGATTDSAEVVHASEEIHTNVIESVMAEPTDHGSSATETDSDFRAACARLHERLPHIADETAWDSSLLGNARVAESSDDASHDSLEHELPRLRERIR